MQPARIVTRNLMQWRSISMCVSRFQAEVAPVSSPPLDIPPPSTVEKTFSPKIEKLVTEISHLNLIEVSELSDLLKKRLNLPDAPVMPMGGFAAAAPGMEEEEEDVAAKTVKTSFTVKLMAFQEDKKVPLIKEIKALMEGMNLVQAKKFVEGSPAVVKADIGKEEAEKLKEALEKVGATVQVD